MFEQSQGSDKSLSRPLKGIAISGVGLLLSVGFCGLDAHLYPHSEFGGSALAVIGAGLGLISALVLGVSVLMLIITAIANIMER